LQGRRQVPIPEGWAGVQKKLSASANAEVRQKAQILSVIFGDQQALASLRQSATDAQAPVESRLPALQTLIDLRDKDLLTLLSGLLTDAKMRGPALRGLAIVNDPTIPDLIVKQYATFTDADKLDAINTLAARPASAVVMLEAMEKGKIQRRDLSAFTARQLVGLNDKKLTEKLTSVWGSIRPTAQDKTALLSKYRTIVPPVALEKADRAHGRALFTKTCANCHTLF